MTTYYWPVVLPLIAIGLIAYAIAAVGGARRGYHHGAAQFHDDLSIVRAENKRLAIHDSLTLCYADGLEQEREHMTAQNADLLEALQDAQAEIKALGMQTIEVPQVEPVAVKPRRTSKKVGSE